MALIVLASFSAEQIFVHYIPTCLTDHKEHHHALHHLATFSIHKPLTTLRGFLRAANLVFSAASDIPGVYPAPLRVWELWAGK